ncbi:hypothetical protein FEE95_03145 [Maribacter algarum]|uniref:N-acetyltransferase domain-containing protein n=1 Tax=Maribacter algarum (ex Zhang et al. 2020) TaxID=2578118 RepID=A0A5S3PTV8_9FLAO|nr:hypothetical protein [Maribacter algarum]TMM58441.1 hypothetical protein FEE95_03145 [Maribacter algarum]
MVENLCFELNKFLQKQFNYKTPPARVAYSNKINARRAKFDLYLRYRLSNKDELVIARMFFKEKRKGHGTRFLKFICQVAPIHNIQYIIIENPNENSLAFGQKIGFTELFNGSLSISIENLNINLRNSK